MTTRAETPLKVLFLSSEADPFYKVGGLGDYASSLPSALQHVAHKESQPLDLRVGLPFHQPIGVNPTAFSRVASLQVPKAKGNAKGSAFLTNKEGIPHYFLRRSGKASGYQHVYSPTAIEDARKYIFFSLASLELCRVLRWQPDVIHANDWHTAMSVYQLRHRLARDPFFQRTSSLQVIHNLPFMGAGSEGVLLEYGIPPLPTETMPDWAWHFPLAMGLASADHIAAVSPSYAQELQADEFGSGLTQFFIQNAAKTSGILNGIDTHLWDPATDIHLTQGYSQQDMAGKQANKLAILQDSGLESAPDGALLIAVTRLDYQKGTDLLIAALPELLQLDCQVIVLGTGDRNYEDSLRDLQERFPSKLRTFLEFNSALSHRMYAGGDILLMPSRYEPCGLSQMIAMRYGCIPVARAVGGLRDTIHSEVEGNRTGYLFNEADQSAFVKAVGHALRDYAQKSRWKEIQARAMSMDFSWEQSASAYLHVFQEMLEKSTSK